ncbi:BON domain-containing protein [Rhizobium sp. NLR16b]|uniref:BON domain-containing protein n=1 Tax=Rhizobium sp. NLR16b TaxID=2731113 RepID=UPI001C839217|nr:BON domain-containing protein [Rhizobium sp. NLR16b]MBX5260730.1 BON domain-containing protein [Rhizobium sp. NLR16b]
MVFKEPTFHGLAPEVEAEIANRASLEAAVANALAIAGGIDASDVKVTMEEDQVVLTGTVGTVGEIERATAVARAVEGETAVQNRILLGGSAVGEPH